MRDYTGAPDPKLYEQAEEKALARGDRCRQGRGNAAVATEDFAAAMTAHGETAARMSMPSSTR